MKNKLIFIVVAFFCVLSSSVAQDVDSVIELANKELANYAIDPVKNVANLERASQLIEEAIKMEPENIGLNVTLGDIYYNLYQSAIKGNDEINATAYLDNAKKSYADALLKDPNNFDANYSMGALYYNKAAYSTQQMNELPEDFSTNGLKKIQVIKNEIMDSFDKALPYFKKSESINPNHLKTLTALFEIYSRKEDDTSLEMKKRLDIMIAGGKNQTSYFK